jgi:hypothetical protein
MEVCGMSKLSIIDTIIILTICYELVTLAILYYLVTLDIRMLKKAESVDQLCKLTLKYAKKRNFNKGIILRDLMKKIESGKKFIKIGKWCLLLEIIFVSLYFIARDPDMIRFGEKILFGKEQRMMLDDIMILCGISVFWAIYYFMLVHKRNIVAHEQFSRLL